MSKSKRLIQNRHPASISLTVSWILLTISVTTVNSQVVTASPLIILSSSLSDGRGVCPGDELTFTCVTNGSASLAWSSDDYIGRGGIQLEFASYHDPGRIARNRASPIGTQATLISKEIEENETQGILESQLNVIVTSDYQIATINCLHVDTATEESTRFQLLDRPGAPKGVEVNEIPDDRKSSGSCVLTLQLSHPSNIDSDEIPHLIYYVDYLSQRDVITATSYTFVVQNCTQDLHINVTAVNRCGRMGGRVVDIAPTFLPVSVSITQGPNVGLAVGLSIFALFVVAVCTVVAIIVIWHCCYFRRRSNTWASARPRHIMDMYVGDHVRSPEDVPYYEEPDPDKPDPSKLIMDLKKMKALLSHSKVRDCIKEILEDEFVKKLIKEIKFQG